MARRKIIAAAAAAAIAFSTATVNAGSPIVTNHPHGGSSSPWLAWTVIACAGLIVTAAFIASRQQNRPLTAAEATTCGLAFWFNPPR